MISLHWLKRRLEKPFKHIAIISRAVWRQDLRDMADKKNRHVLTKIFLRLIINIETIAEGIVLCLMMILILTPLVIFIPLRWIYVEIYDIWIP